MILISLTSSWIIFSGVLAEKQLIYSWFLPTEFTNDVICELFLKSFNSNTKKFLSWDVNYFFFYIYSKIKPVRSKMSVQSILINGKFSNNNSNNTTSYFISKSVWCYCNIKSVITYLIQFFILFDLTIWSKIS